ncbi:MAG: hypothetical protein ACI4T3_01375 [Lactobacillus sp.]
MGEWFVSIEAYNTIKVIKGNNATEFAYTFTYNGKNVDKTNTNLPKGTVITIGKTVKVGQTDYSPIIKCDAKPEAVGLYVYNSDLVNYNWGGKRLLSHWYQALKVLTARKAVRV